MPRMCTSVLPFALISLAGCHLRFSSTLAPRRACRHASRCAAPLAADEEFVRKTAKQAIERGDWQSGLQAFERWDADFGSRSSPVLRAALVGTVVTGMCRAGRAHQAAQLLLGKLARDATLASALRMPTIHGLLNALATTPGSMADARRIVAHLRAGNGTVDQKTYCILIKGFGRAGAGPRIGDTLRAMRRDGLEVDVISANAALDAYARCRMWRQATALVCKMEVGAQGMPPPDGRTYNTLLKAYALGRRLDEAVDLAERMVLGEGRDSALREEAHAGQLMRGEAQAVRGPRHPFFNEVSLNTLIDAYARAGDLRRALALLEQPLDQGVSALPWRRDGAADELSHRPTSPEERRALRPGPQAFTSVIRALSQEGRLRDAIVLAESMSRAGVEPTTVSFNALMSACLDAGAVDRARRTFSIMLDPASGVRPNAQTFDCMVSGLCKQVGDVRAPAPDLHEVLAILGDMQAAGFSRTLRTYNALLGAVARRGDARGADVIMVSMEEAGVAPSRHTYTALLRVHGKCGDLPGLEKTLAALERSSLGLDAVAVHEYMAACLRVEARAQAQSRRASTAVNSERSTIANVDAQALGEAGRQALRMLERLDTAALDVRPSARTYTVLIHGLGQWRSGAAVAWRLFRRMVAAGVQLDPPAARSVLIVCKRYLGVGEAEEVLRAVDKARWPRAAVEEVEREVEAMSRLVLYTAGEGWKNRPTGNRRQGGARRRARRGEPGESQPDELFEKHGWNEFDNGFRVL